MSLNSLQVISGYRLPKKEGDSAASILDPEVVVKIDGVKADQFTVGTKARDNSGG